LTKQIDDAASEWLVTEALMLFPSGQQLLQLVALLLLLMLMLLLMMSLLTLMTSLVTMMWMMLLVVLWLVAVLGLPTHAALEVTHDR
jgi:hypothetical protein